MCVCRCVEESQLHTFAGRLMQISRVDCVDYVCTHKFPSKELLNFRRNFAESFTASFAILLEKFCYICVYAYMYELYTQTHYVVYVSIHTYTHCKYGNIMYIYKQTHVCVCQNNRRAKHTSLTKSKMYMRVRVMLLIMYWL